MKKNIVKNYILLSIIVVFTVLITLYFCNLIKINRINKLSTSPLTGNVKEITYNEMDEALAEVGESIIYFGYTNNKEIYTMEEKMLKIINKNKLNNNFLYINLNGLSKDDAYVKLLKNKFIEFKNVSFKAPIIMYYAEGKVVYMKYSSNKIISEKELNNIINTYKFES